MKIIIIQTSPPGTGSTVLTNAVYGLIPSLKDKSVIYIDFQYDEIDDKLYETYGDIIVLKTHYDNINYLIEKYENKYKLFFLCSERIEKNKFINCEYKFYKNVLVFQFNELNESETNSINNIIENIYEKLKKMLDIELNIQNGIDRIVSMNNLYEQIKKNSFKYYDKFYHIHGSHRNRP